MKPFDAEIVYDEQIAPLMEKVIAICKTHGIPLVASFCYQVKESKESEQDDEFYCTTFLTRDREGESWSPDNFRAAKAEILRKPTIVAITITGPGKPS